MSRVEQLERDIRSLSAEELRDFRAWFIEHDAELWDRQFEADVKSGKLDRLAERALRDHANGRSTKL
jgi:hypothetical protein